MLKLHIHKHILQNRNKNDAGNIVQQDSKNESSQTDKCTLCHFIYK